MSDCGGAVGKGAPVCAIERDKIQSVGVHLLMAVQGHSLFALLHSFRGIFACLSLRRGCQISAYTLGTRLHPNPECRQFPRVPRILPTCLHPTRPEEHMGSPLTKNNHGPAGSPRRVTAHTYAQGSREQQGVNRFPYIM